MSIETDYLFLDFETRNQIDLELRGLDNYARSAQVLMLGWAVNREPVRIWLPEFSETSRRIPTPMPVELKAALLDPKIVKVAWYAPFERNIFRYALNIDIPIEQWRDAAILARHLSMPGSLEAVCDILKIGKDEAKIKDGERLIKLFCIPHKKLVGQQTLYGRSDGFNDPREFPLDWKMFIDYCRRDVEVERTLWFKMLPFCFPEDQWEDWFNDQHMNECGLPMNVARAQKALSLAIRYKDEVKETLNWLTGLENANSRDQLLGWLKPRGYDWGSLNKEFVEAELKNPNSKLTPEARDVLMLRRKGAQISYTKLERALDIVSPDGFLRHQFVYMGAARTGRWSAFGAQVMNMPRPMKELKKMKPEEIFDLIDREAYDEIKAKFDGSTLPFVASVIRMMFEAPND